MLSSILTNPSAIPFEWLRSLTTCSQPQRLIKVISSPSIPP
ncbi:Uncharacterised protein [Vibrio cholerae]|nr:Uncharacterised protein [Vibrio cholerae]